MAWHRASMWPTLTVLLSCFRSGWLSIERSSSFEEMDFDLFG